MNWQLFAALSALFTALSAIAIKFAANRLEKQSVGLVCQYVVAVAVSWLIAFWLRGNIVISAVPLYLGILQTFATFLYWNAMKISMSKTSTAIHFKDAISALLGIIFLDEMSRLNPKFALGLVCCVIAIGILSRKKHELSIVNWRWLGSILGAVVIYGFVVFVMKLLSVSMSPEVFASNWYLGSLLASFAVSRLERPKSYIPERRVIVSCAVAGILVPLALMLLMASFNSGGPLVFVTPLTTSVVVVASILFGLFIFKERKHLSPKELSGLVIGVMGVILLVI